MTTVGGYLAKRLQELEIKDYFAIPGDYNLTLLDEILKEKSLHMINCCNELNAAYAADGYARIHGVAAMFVTYSVGGLSAINGVAGAYAENLPLLLISGGPNTNSVQDAEILHHTLGIEDYDYVRDMYARVTCHSIYIHRPSDAPMQIDRAIACALEKQKPVYIEIACNIADSETSAPTKHAFNVGHSSDTSSLKAAVENTVHCLNSANKPMMVLGSKAKSCQATENVAKLSEKTGYALATMPDAKGLVSEQHPNYIGIYWGPVSSPACAEIVESSDWYLFIGPNFNDYTTVGHACNLKKKKMIIIADGRVSVAGHVYTDVYMNDFLKLLQQKLHKNTTALQSYQRIAGEELAYIEPADMDGPLATRYLFGQVQKRLTSNHAVLAETGDSWFNTQRLRLPAGSHYAIQMQYGSIGWSVGALLGMQAALRDRQRVWAFIGDGSFQMSAQELSTLIRYRLNPVIFLLNNGAYTIEVQIHDGPYNEINNWHYAQLIEVFNGERHNAQAFKVRTPKELLTTLDKIDELDGLCFVEVFLDKDDCNKSLLEWGARVAAYNSRPPKA